MSTPDPCGPIETLWPGLRTAHQTQTRNALVRVGISCIGQLTGDGDGERGWSAADLLRIPRISEWGVAEIRRVLYAAGLSLRDEGGRVR